MGTTGPVYLDNGRDVIAVSVELHLARLTNLTMELVAGRVDDDGQIVPVPQLAEITNLRGFSAQVSRTTGAIIHLVPLPVIGESEHPDQVTKVHYLIPERSELPPGNDPSED